MTRTIPFRGDMQTTPGCARAIGLCRRHHRGPGGTGPCPERGGEAILYAVRLRAFARASAALNAIDEGHPGFGMAALRRSTGQTRPLC